MKKILTLLLAVLLLPAVGCGDKQNGQIDLMDTVDGTAIVSAADLEEFIEFGQTDTATLLASIDLEGEMLKLTAVRGPIIIEGNGFSISGGGDCVIRMEDGCKLTLNNVTLIGKSDTIGCLGDAEIGGLDATVSGERNAILGTGYVAISASSLLRLSALTGSAISAKGITLAENSAVTASGGLNAIHTTKNELVLKAGASLSAETQTNYNAVKCAATLVMGEGSSFTAVNHGEYHGAEVEQLQVEGCVTINATGGDKGMGMFIFTQTEDICVVGSCQPQAQFENGQGSLTFVNSRPEYDKWLADKAAEQAAAAAAAAEAAEGEGEEAE